MVIAPNDWGIHVILSKVLSSGIVITIELFGDMIITPFNNIPGVALPIIESGCDVVDSVLPTQSRMLGYLMIPHGA